ncbi:hypothetical protein [Arthrobacter globiformis]|uniref:Uncharacterized protein n=1 Tax=Arthrobacter globiformis TaxID=1665 RepID=A0A328HHT6_ARTGO|nr:hypothetical protein [Arthrobacter globiformis]RAM37711.1 hypothetical protein DBZ45_08915 [Arthrobacter globiformis]
MFAATAYRAQQTTEEDLKEKFAAAQLGALELMAPTSVREAAVDMENFTDKIFHDVLFGPGMQDGYNFRGALRDYHRLKGEYVKAVKRDLNIPFDQYAVGGSQLTQKAESTGPV